MNTVNGETGTAKFPGYVVCIGASAGGLDALEKFFQACPDDTGAAFVVIQHLSPDHKSMMNNLLARHTGMPVVMVEDDMPVEANQVYLIPPGAVMHVRGDHLHLTPKNPRGLTLPIDIFITSLAEAFGQRAIGVILSGTGTDGTRGAIALNAAGGFVLAQDPETAKFDGMPRSVIATGVVDAVLSAEELPGRLLAHIHNLPYQETDERPKVVPYALMTTDQVFSAILQLLQQVCGIDFADYKPATVMRRIERRMQVRHTPELVQYLALLESDRAEILTLRREMLISVTSFFRDPETFEILADKVIRPMVAEREAGDMIRVWAAGVATGEEAYSIAMLFIEAFEQERRWPNLKIFATDVDQQCIETAGIGQYPESAAAELSPERLERFFVRKGDNFVVKNELRQCIVFARHNLLADPPFTKMDLVVCRNTLIYFKSSAQERALRSLQYAVNQGGVLLLGSSESLSAMTQGLETLNTKHKLFRRKGSLSLPFPERFGARAGFTPAVTGRPAPLRAARHAPTAMGMADAGTTALLNLFAPPALLVNSKHEAVHLYGNIGQYLQTREGTASLNIDRMLPDNLVPVASALLFKTFRDRSSIVSDLVELRRPGEPTLRIRLSSHSVELPGEERLALLCLENRTDLPDGELESINVDAETLQRVNILERELAATRESLQATIEELETSNEELQATNEELMASNEELQSSNEELQSVNEEMSTVNAEFQEKMLLLNRLNADLDSMAKAAAVATVFVDGQLRITRFSPDATQLFKLRDSDLGRPLDDIADVLDYPDLMEDMRATLGHGRMIEREIGTVEGGKTYLARILPYQVPSLNEPGVVATFVDVTAFHDARRLQTVIDALPEHIAVIDPTGRIVLVNAAWRRFAQANGDSELARSGPGSNYLDVCEACGTEGGDYASRAIKGIRDVLGGVLPKFAMEYPCHSPDEQRWFVMNVAPVLSQGYGAVISHVNITSWQQRSDS
jgi:two-component system CheB/CheR fusion protein